MTVKIYRILEDFVPAVKVEKDSPPVQVVLNNRRRWESEEELVAALEARGYAFQGSPADLSGEYPSFEFVGVEGVRQGRPPLETLEEQAQKKFQKKS